MAKKAGAGKEPSIADVDFNNPAERDAYIKHLQRKAGENVHAAVKRLKALGIIDEHGNLIDKTLPPDMLPGSRCQVPRGL